MGRTGRRLLSVLTDSGRLRMKKLLAVSVIILMILWQGVLYADCQGKCGDANNDWSVGVSDAINLLNYVFIIGSTPPRPVYACGDANGDCKVNLSDALYIINYVFIIGSPPPGDCCAGAWEGQGGDCCPFIS
jgi:hypothetical protein